MITALIPGSFDPPTNGHVDVVARVTGLFDRTVVAVVGNPSKTPLFTSDERVGLLRSALSPYEKVEVASFDGLLVNFASEVGADVIVKGLRAITDFDYELQLAQMNRHLSGIVTMFVATKPALGYLSSSLVKEVRSYGGDIEELVPPEVAAAFKEKFDR